MKGIISWTAVLVAMFLFILLGAVQYCTIDYVILGAHDNRWVCGYIITSAIICAFASLLVYNATVLKIVKKYNFTFLRYSLVSIFFLSLNCVMMNFGGKSTHIVIGNSSIDMKELGFISLMTALILCKVFEYVLNRMSRKSREKLLNRVLAWNKDHDLGAGIPPVISNNGIEHLVIMYLDKEKLLALYAEARANKNGYYSCAWAVEDPKNTGKYCVAEPNGYQLLFNLDTGDLKIQGLEEADK